MRVYVFSGLLISSIFSVAGAAAVEVISTEREFEMPVGYEDTEGDQHTDGHMRLAV